jgi:predicted Zn-dependent peptidase
MDFKHKQLDNGLTIIAEVNPSAASMAAGFFVRTGSRDETPEVAGVSHFLEHMMFKGTPRRTSADINRDFDQLGAHYNAFTSEENTVYYAAVLPEFQDRATDLLCDMLRPSLRQEDFNIEKNVILEEIAMYQDTPRYRMFENLMAAHFCPHPLGNSVLGTQDSIKALKRDQMQAYFDRRYSPGNMVVVAVGNMDFDAFTAKVGAMCGRWPNLPTSRQRALAPRNPARKAIVDPKLTRQNLGIISPAPTGQDEFRYAAQMAATIIGDSTGSRLFYALIDPAIADEASMSYDAMDGEGAFITMISTGPERAAEAARIALAEFQKFMQEGPSDSEMTAAKNKIASGATLKGELPMGRLTSVGFDWIYRNQYVPLADQIKTLFAVTKEQVLQVVQNYDIAAATTVTLGPGKEPEA